MGEILHNVVALNEEDVAADFAEQVAEVCPRPESDFPVLVTVPIPPTSPLRWLSAQKRFPQFYWQDRRGELEVAGCGNLISEQSNSCMDTCIDSVNAWIHSHPQGHQFTFFGGGAFDSAQQTSVEWAEFPTASFTQPEVVLVRRGDDYSLLLGTRVQQGESIAKITRRLARLLQKSCSFEDSPLEVETEIVEQTDIPSRDAWNASFENLISQLESEIVEKVVVARRRDLSLSAAQKPEVLLERLMKHQEESYSFLYSPSPLSWFASKSPECLLRLTGSRLESEALGGTAPLVHCSEEDTRHAEHLRSSSKVLHEHRLVVEDVERKITKLTDSFVKSNTPELVKLSHVQHLRSRLAGIAKQGLDLSEAISTLHPTAAVCGHPTKVAVQAIADFEPFARGWYAGPVGLITADVSEFAVALRCMLARGNQISIYGGAGIVTGSTAEDEWNEVDGKMSSAMELFS